MILQFQGVSWAARPPYDAGISHATFALDSGDLLLLRVDPDNPRTPLADLAQGLVEPESGAVQFMGEDWRSAHPDRIASLRGRIGRVFYGGGWISNLDVDENITLAQRYHTERPEAEIREEAAALARGFGLAEVPKGRPADIPRQVLRCAQWVRAFLGHPRLILLDHPARDLPDAWLDLLVKKAAEARSGGAGILWITGDAQEMRHPALNPTLKFELRENTMCALKIES
jgi:phospholipid/cholesterol/gamma-HCH transport system ATP-binding protein